MTDTTIDIDLTLWFSIFNTADSHIHWKNYIRYANEQIQFTQEVTKRWINALIFLQSQLGNRFLHPTKPRHPLTGLITGVNPWQVERVIRYAEIIQHLAATDPDYEHFRRKLIGPVAAKAEYMDFLLVADILHSAGLEVYFPKPIPTQKNPDLVITDPSCPATIFGEVSSTHAKKKRNDESKSYDDLYKIIGRHLQNPLYSAGQLRIPPPLYTKKLEKALVRLQNQVEEKNTWAEYEDRYITVRLYPLSQEATFNTWLQEADRRKGFHGIPQNFDDTDRITGYKIADEASHFLPHQTGLIFLPINALHFWQQHTEDAKQSILRCLRKHPNVLGVFLYSELQHPDAVLFRFNNTDDRFTRQQLSGLLTRYSVFVQNEAFTNSIHKGTLQRILTTLDPH